MFQPDQNALNLVTFVNNNTADLVVRSGRRSEFEASVDMGKKSIVGTNDPVGFYITQGDQVLFNNFFPKGKNLDDTLSNVKDNLESYAQQRNVRTLKNQESTIGNWVQVSVSKIPLKKNSDGEYTESGAPAIPRLGRNGNYTFKFNEGYQFEVRRIAGSNQKPLYVSIIGLSSDGAIFLLKNKENFDSSNIILKPANPAAGKLGPVKESETIFTQPPVGTDYYKVFVTNQPTDFSNVQRDVARKGLPPVGLNPLESLLSSTTRRRGAKPLTAPTAPTRVGSYRYSGASQRRVIEGNS